MMQASLGSAAPSNGVAAIAAVTRPVARLLAGWRGDALAGAAGGLFPFAFAPIGFGWLSYPLLAILFFVSAECGARRAAWRGGLFGLAQFLAGAGWLHLGLHSSGTAPTLSSIALTGAATALLACYPAFAAGAASLAGGRDPKRVLVLLPLAWTVAEYLRSVGWTAFPWLLTGYAQIDTPLAGFAPLVGVYGTGLMAATVAALLALLVLQPRRGAVAIAAILLVFAGGALCAKSTWSTPVGAPLRVAMLQGNVVQDEKWSNHARIRMLNWYKDQTREHWNSDLIVWPETAIADSTENVAAYLANLKEWSASDRKDVLVGVVEGDFAKGGYFNSLVNLRGGAYHKRRLIPIVESSSGLGLGDLLAIPASDFRAGEEAQTPLLAGGVPIGASICFEIAFGSEIRRALPDALLLVNVSNDGAFRDTGEPLQHHEIARFRALETGRYVVRVVNGGMSSIIGPRGEVTVSAPVGTEGVVTGEVQPLAGMTPYVLLGDGPIIVLTLAGLVLAGVLRWRGRADGAT
jgi:apolipoprotein N-acyltransferase